jgi:NAD(P)-dependent dehydrogenase (short-subunit alcohol dehydrogenase family)
MGQPKLPKLPKDINLRGKTALVTGANSGIGFETCRQLLHAGLNTLIMAVRTVTNGEKARNELLEDEFVKSLDPQPEILVIHYFS